METNNDYWAWQGDGEDYLESLACPILIEAHDLRGLISAVFDDVIKTYPGVPGVKWLYNKPEWEALKARHGITN